MNKLCPPCVTKSTQPINEQSTRLKSLRYTLKTSNMKSVIDNYYYQKVNRPNFFFEMGNDSYKTATDRFNLNDYEKLMSDILNEELDLPDDEVDEVDD